MKLDKDEVLKVPYKWFVFRPDAPRGRIQGGAKKGYLGPLLQRISSSDQKDTATNQIHSNYLEAFGKKCC